MTAAAVTQVVAPELLRLRAESFPDRIPIVVDGAEGLTYAQWDRRSNAVAHGLLTRGIGTGDRVALVFGGMDWVEYAVVYLGVLKAGASTLR